MSAPIAAVLTLSPDNPSNTTIFDADNKALYTVHTEHTKAATTTRVQNAEDVELAALEWREVLPDKVTLAGGKGPMSLREWLRTSLVPFYLKEWVFSGCCSQLGNASLPRSSERLTPTAF